MTIDPTVGSFDYTPTVGYIGADSFVYTVTNSYGATATATVNITVTSAGTVTTSVVASGNSVDATAPYAISSNAFTPVAGANYLVFVGHISSPGDDATLTTTGSLSVVGAPLAVSGVGSVYGWLWQVQATGASSSTITATFLNPSASVVNGHPRDHGNDVIEVVGITGSGYTQPSALAGTIANQSATVTLASPVPGDSELAFLYVNGDLGGDPQWTTSSIVTLAGSFMHSGGADDGFGATVGYAATAIPSATTKNGIPAHNGDGYVSIAVNLSP